MYPILFFYLMGCWKKYSGKVFGGCAEWVIVSNRGEFIVSVAGGEDNKIIVDGRIAREKIFSGKLREQESSGCFMELCWQGDRVSEFSPKSGTDYFSLLYKTDVCKIKAVELNLSVAIKAGFVASLSGQAFECLRHALRQAFWIL